MNGMDAINPVERERTYHYSDGTKLYFTNVTALGVTKSGFHKLEFDDGHKAIVAPGWRWISLNVDEWSR